MSTKKPTYSIVDIFVLFALTVAVGFFYAGFFFPDKFFLKHSSALHLYISLAIRVIFPILFIGALLAFHRIKTGQLAASKIILLIASLFIIGLLAYPFANYFYNRLKGFEKHIGSYHPYLQLSPQEFKPQKSDATKPFRVFCLGGSTTEWRDSQDRGWPVRVQDALRKSLGREDIEVYNLGREWYTSMHSMINYEVNLRSQKPDLIIIMHAINDLLHNADFSYFSHEEYRSDYRHFFGPVNNIVARQGFESFLFEKFRRLWYNKERQTVDQLAFPGVAAFIRNLSTVIDLAELDGTRVVLMTQPNLFKESMNEAELKAIYMINNEAIGAREKWSPSTGLRGFRLYNEALYNLARTRNIPVIDLAEAVPKSLDYFDDDVHYTDPAFDLIGEFVSTELLRQNLLQ